MTLTTSLLLALSLSTDAFAAATGKGAARRHPPVTEVFRIGASWSRRRSPPAWTAPAVGISLAFVDVSIAVLAALIGTVAFTMACCGASIGLKAGPLLGRWAEFLGGLGLIGIGTKILLDHTLL